MQSTISLPACSLSRLQHQFALLDGGSHSLPSRLTGCSCTKRRHLRTWNMHADLLDCSSDMLETSDAPGSLDILLSISRSYKQANAVLQMRHLRSRQIACADIPHVISIHER